MDPKHLARLRALYAQVPKIACRHLRQDYGGPISMGPTELRVLEGRAGTLPKPTALQVALGHPGLLRAQLREADELDTRFPLVSDPESGRCPLLGGGRRLPGVCLPTAHLSPVGRRRGPSLPLRVRARALPDGR